MQDEPKGVWFLLRRRNLDEVLVSKVRDNNKEVNCEAEEILKCNSFKI